MNAGYAEFDKLSAQDRRDVFEQTARDLGAIAQAVEKDFWVCRVLDVMFAGFDATDEIGGAPRA